MESFFNFDKLEQQQRYTLGKTERLKSRKTIDLLFEKGKSFSSFPFRVVYTFTEAAGEDAALKAGFSVSKRNFKKAVHRNRIKRLMREAYRLQKEPLQRQVIQQQKCLVLFILFNGKELPEYTLVKEKMQFIIQKLQRISNEKLATDS